jgi:hypothetical protein
MKSDKLHGSIQPILVIGASLVIGLAARGIGPTSDGERSGARSIPQLSIPNKQQAAERATPGNPAGRRLIRLSRGF